MDHKKRDGNTPHNRGCGEMFILFLLATVLGTLAGILPYLIGAGR